MNVASDPTVGFECDPTDCVAVCGNPGSQNCTNVLCTKDGKDIVKLCKRVAGTPQDPISEI